MAPHNRATDVDSSIEILEQFKSRIALISLDGAESGTGFLVAEKLLLTAQHVVESPAGVIADPRSIEVTFDFWYHPHTTWAEAGETVPVTDIVVHSPPTDKERSTINSVDWEAPRECLDYAILQLEHRILTWSRGQFRSRGHYPIHFTSYRITRDQVLLLGHHPRGETLKDSRITGPHLNKNATRIIYQVDTQHGSSGGAIVNNRGRLVGLHHFASDTDKHGVPITAVAQDLKARKFDFLVEQDVAHLGRYSANAKRRICQAIANDWQSLETYLGMPDFITSSDTLWDWLSANNKLRKLRYALEAAGRTELVQLLDNDVVIVDLSAIENITDLADRLVESVEAAKASSKYLRSAIRAKIFARMLSGEIESLSSTPVDRRAQLKWRISWRSELDRITNEINAILPLLPSKNADASFTQPRLKGVIRAAYGIQSITAKLGELAQSPELLTR